MIEIQQVDTTDRKQVNEFVEFHYSLYRNTPQWVPPFYSDIKLMLNKNRHPFYEMNDADFFTAKRDGQVVGRIGVLENRSFNSYHKTHQTQFYLFDTIDDKEVAAALFDRAAEWSKKRGMDAIVGPKGFSALDGYGILIEGFEERQMMNMMNYNFPYYATLLEGLGFEKEVDFVSCYIKRESFFIPEKVKEVAKRVQERGTFKVINFKNQADIRKWAKKIGKAYNNTFINNWEYYPLTEREVKMLVDNIMMIAIPSLLKIITNKEDEIVGFLFAFPDVSAAMQKYGGNVSLFRPWAVMDIINESKKADCLAVNGAGVLPEYHGRGGNALLYSEMETTINSGIYDHVEFTQVAETAVQMRKDLITNGGKAYKNHRVFRKAI
jgi:hypothetical protein